MAAVAGRGGSIVCANAQTMVKSWSVNHSADALDVTSFDSSGLREFLGGLSGWSGSFTANWSTLNVITVGGTAIAAKFRLGSTTAGHLLHGSVFITGVNYSNDVGGVATQDYSFQGTGKLASTTT